jgi:hypothetical protein
LAIESSVIGGVEKDDEEIDKVLFDSDRIAFIEVIIDSRCCRQAFVCEANWIYTDFSWWSLSVFTMWVVDRR